MQRIQGNLWKFNTPSNWVVIPTNGKVRYDGACVMGRGVALQAKQRYPKLPYELGERLKQFGNVVFTFENYNLLTFPVKHNWWEKADIELIESSARQLHIIVDRPVYLPLVGCGNGKLDVELVIPILDKYLDDHFILVTLGDNHDRPR